MEADLVTIKVTFNTRTMLRILAAHTDQDMYQIAESLAWDEMKRRRIKPAEIVKRAAKRFNGAPETSKAT